MSRKRKHVANQFDHAALTRICTLPEDQFGVEFGMTKEVIATTRWVKEPENFYFFKDNGSDVLAVAHLDTVVAPNRRAANFVNTAAGPVVFSGALDDRLGAYIILDLLPRLGITHDVLLTVGEESGNSTAQFFDASKEYNWMIEFDRGGTDVVMYQYDDDDTRTLVRESGAVVGEGIFTDICFLDHLCVKGFNWGVGYRDYHGPRSHAYLNDTFDMVASYLRFHTANADTEMPHADLGFDDQSQPIGTADASWWRSMLNLDDDLIEVAE